MRILKSIEQDATYTSHEACEFLASLSGKRRGEYFCYDLKNFTDFLPVSLQRLVMKHLYGSAIADRWVQIMSEPIEYRGRQLRFTRGQPMGLLSS